MAAPTYESTTATTFEGSNPTAHAANFPATVGANDLLIAFVAMDASCTFTTPSGWTQLFQYTSATVSGGIWIKKAVGDEDGGTIDFVTSVGQDGTIQIMRISGWAEDVKFVSAAVNLDATEPTYIRAGYDADLLWVAFQLKSNTVAFGATPSSDATWTNETKSGSDVATSGQCATATNAESQAFQQETTFWQAGSSNITGLLAVFPSSISVPAGGGVLRNAGLNGGLIS